MYNKSLHCSAQGFLGYGNSASQVMWAIEIDNFIEMKSDGGVIPMGRKIYHDDSLSIYCFSKGKAYMVIECFKIGHVFSGANPSIPKTNLTPMVELTSDFASNVRTRVPHSKLYMVNNPISSDLWTDL